jgi:hypothetical protein
MTTTARFSSPDIIEVTRDGRVFYVPDDMANADRAELDAGGVEIAPFSAPPPTRESVKEEIDTIWLTKHTAGYPHDFGGAYGVKLLQTRESDQPFWLALAQVASIMVAQGGGASSCGAIRTADNTNVPVTASEALAAMLGMQAHLGEILAHSWSLKDQVTEADDMDAVLAIDINAGWPA